MKKGKILSGMRPTGILHLGNYLGSLTNWVKLQDEYECYYMIADYHALTTGYEDTHELKQNTRDMVVDWLACGLTPEKSVLFRQSDVKAHAELHLLLSMITPLGWLMRCPTYKEQLREIKDKDIHTYGFLGYPVLQAADILIYKADTVPVGEDQLPHVEMTREIARRFNNFYGEVFPEPRSLLSRSPRIPGIDGRKMSKSYANAIYLSDSPEIIKNKVKQMFTDPAKIRANDKGHPEGCVVFAFHSVYSEDIKDLETKCRAGELGCVKDKDELSKKIIEALAPVREKRENILKQRNIVEDVLHEGSRKASETAEKTMEEVRKAVKI